MKIIQCSYYTRKLFVALRKSIQYRVNTDLISDSPLKGSEQRSFASSQKSRRPNHFCV